MSMPVIIDIIAAVVLAVFVIAGLRRGLLRTGAGLLSAVVALVGSGLISNAITPLLSERVRPVLETKIEEKLNETLVQSGVGFGTVTPSNRGSVSMPDLSTDHLNITQILSLLNLDQEAAQSVAKSALQQVQANSVSALSAVAAGFAESILRMILFSVSFAVLTFVLKLVTKTLRRASRLPGLRTVDALCGGVLGLAEGALCLFLAIWVLRRFGVSFETQAVAQTKLFQFFTTHSPLSALAFLGG